jgi:hypothetical protein
LLPSQLEWGEALSPGGGGTIGSLDVQNQPRTFEIDLHSRWHEDMIVAES